MPKILWLPLTSSRNFAAGQEDIRTAEKRYREEWNSNSARYGQWDPRTVTSMINVAIALIKLQHQQDAQEILQLAVDSMNSRLGPRHPMTICVKCNLSIALYLSRQTSVAESIFEELRSLHHALTLSPMRQHFEMLCRVRETEFDYTQFRQPSGNREFRLSGTIASSGPFSTGRVRAMIKWFEKLKWPEPDQETASDSNTDTKPEGMRPNPGPPQISNALQPTETVNNVLGDAGIQKTVDVPLSELALSYSSGESSLPQQDTALNPQIYNKLDSEGSRRNTSSSEISEVSPLKDQQQLEITVNGIFGSTRIRKKAAVRSSQLESSSSLDTFRLSRRITVSYPLPQAEQDGKRNQDQSPNALADKQLAQSQFPFYDNSRFGPNLMTERLIHDLVESHPFEVRDTAHVEGGTTAEQPGVATEHVDIEQGIYYSTSTVKTDDSSLPTSPPKVSITVYTSDRKDCQINASLDTGAESHCISVVFCSFLGYEKDTVPYDGPPYVGANSEPVAQLGIVKIFYKWEGRLGTVHKKSKFLVVPDLPTDIILGASFLSVLQANRYVLPIHLDSISKMAKVDSLRRTQQVKAARKAEAEKAARERREERERRRKQIENARRTPSCLDMSGEPGLSNDMVASTALVLLSGHTNAAPTRPTSFSGEGVASGHSHIGRPA